MKHGLRPLVEEFQRRSTKFNARRAYTGHGPSASETYKTRNRLVFRRVLRACLYKPGPRHGSELQRVVAPAEEWEISASIDGQIDGIYFSEGQSVSKGDLLAAHGDAIFEAKIARLDVEAAELRFAAARKHLKDA